MKELFIANWAATPIDPACKGCGHYREDPTIGWICNYSDDRAEFKLPMRKRVMTKRGDCIPKKPCEEKSKYPWTVGDFGTEEVIPKPGCARSRNARQVRCVETGILYNSSAHAARSIGCHRTTINNCIAGRKKTAMGLHWEVV